MTPFEIAFKLHSLGFSVIPSGGGDKGKAPIVNWLNYQQRQPADEEMEKWQQELQPGLWGIVAGAISGLVVIDADTPEGRAEQEAELGKPHVVTPRGGGHWYFAHPGHHVKTASGILPGLDVRGDGGFVNIVGTRQDGKYQILTLPAPDNLISWARLPTRIRAAMNGSKQDTLKSFGEGEKIPEGQRNDYLTRIAGTMRRPGMSQASIEAALLQENATRCEPPLSEDEVRGIARSISGYPPAQETPKVQACNGTPLTDTGNAELLAQLYGDQIRYDHRRRRWLLWRRHHWEPDRDGHIFRLAVETSRQRYQHSVKIDNLKERERVASWSIQSESRMRIDSSLSIARSVKPIADSGESWDFDTWSLGVANGVVNLRTGVLRNGLPDDRITMSTGIAYDVAAKCPRWEQFLTEVFDDKELVDWLWRALGYSISGDTTQQCVFIGHGKGANGKTRFIEALRGAIGDYSYSSPFSTFELYQRTGIPNDLAALEFKRFVTSSETNDNTRLNEARIKAISGGDPITARYLHAEFFTFMPHLKLWLFVNHKPKVVDDSFGFWRRVRLIPFTKQFTGEADDRRLGEKLRSEASGILAWLVRGCLEWQRRGLEPVPECVKAATQEYQEESDRVSGFIKERCVEHPKAYVKAADLYKAYRTWAIDQGLQDKEILTSTAFGRYMGNKYQRARGGDGNRYAGIGLSDVGLLYSFEANITKSNVIPICNDSHVITRKTIQNYTAEAKAVVNPTANGNTPGLSPCPKCGQNEWQVVPVPDGTQGVLTCPCGYQGEGVT